jgi:hypothetical protein
VKPPSWKPAVIRLLAALALLLPTPIPNQEVPVAPPPRPKMAPFPPDEPDEEERAKEQKKLELVLPKLAALADKDAEYGAARKKINDLTAELLGTGEGMELFKLNPRSWEGKGMKEEALFHAYPILSRAKVEKADERATVVASLKKAVHWERYFEAACFSPRHGLRVTRGKETIDFVICFQCAKMKCFRDGVEGGTIIVAATKWDLADRILKDRGQKPNEK